MTGNHGHEHDPGTERIETFSDGVFAIAITLLILEIGVPRLQGGEGLGHALGDLWPQYFAYVLSFVMIGIYWANHHALFKLFVRTDHVFLLLNVSFLMCIAFLPFPTAVLGDYLDDAGQRQAAVTLYAFGLLLPAFGWLCVWLYAGWHRLTDERLDPSFLRFLTVQYLLSNTFYGLAVAISFASAYAALAVCVCLTLLYLLPPRRPTFTE
ncbi:MAG TPA: TMEM175 family protein [Dehalococcoidia bacterium]|nr:TMEM175 family protein [Dehalococcoidia bacterium]